MDRVTNTVSSKESLRSKFQDLQGPVKIAVIAAAMVVSLIFVVRILPVLVAAMGIGLLIAILFIPYWIPTIVAFVRKHPNKSAILALNLFFGWTFVGWVVSLVWAVSDNSSHASQQVVVVNNTVVAGTMALPSQPQIGDVMNGHRFNGMSWVPVQAPASSPTLPQPQYRVGDVVNGHRFDGAAWVPVHAAVPAQIQPPHSPLA